MMHACFIPIKDDFVVANDDKPSISQICTEKYNL
jgi:hypothetical protein